MNDARADHIEETLAGLDRKVAGLGADLRAEMNAGFEKAFRETQGGFEDHRAFSEFLTNGLRDEMTRRFNQVDRRFDNMEERFDRLETLIKKA